MKQYIKEDLEKKETIERQEYPKSQIYQLYMIIDKQEPEQLAKLNFIMNFGVSTDSKKILELAMNQDYPQFVRRI